MTKPAEDAKKTKTDAGPRFEPTSGYIVVPPDWKAAEAPWFRWSPTPLKQARSDKKYWDTWCPHLPKMLIVRATTTYEIVEGGDDGE